MLGKRGFEGEDCCACGGKFVFAFDLYGVSGNQVSFWGRKVNMGNGYIQISMFPRREEAQSCLRAIRLQETSFTFF